MAGKLTREAYRQLVNEDVLWLISQPRSLERDHILQILKDSENYYYGPNLYEIKVEAR